MYDALNFALNKCQGDYVAILNSGDTYIDSHSLANATKSLESNRATFLYSDILFGKDIESASV